MEVMISPDRIISLILSDEKDATLSTSSSWADLASNSSLLRSTWKINGNMGKRLGETTSVSSGSKREGSEIEMPVSSPSSRRAASAGISFRWTPPAGSSQTALPKIWRRTLGITTYSCSMIGRTITWVDLYSTTWKSSLSKRENRWFWKTGRADCFQDE